MMTRAVAYCILLAFIATSIAVVAARPDWVSDQNLFLKNFVNHEFLNVLGVTLAITLASAANIHLQFNRIEEQFNAPNGLARSRADLKQSSFALILLFAAAVFLVVLKPIAAAGAVGEAFFNMVALAILLWHVLLLLSLVQLVFAIPPHFGGRGGSGGAGGANPPTGGPTGNQSPPNTEEKKPQ